MRPSTTYLLLTACAAAVFLCLFLRSSLPEHSDDPRILKAGLTDLCIFTEARYTRHPSQADRHAPFQDHPAALEHFPSGAILFPPFPEKYRAMD